MGNRNQRRRERDARQRQGSQKPAVRIGNTQIDICMSVYGEWGMLHRAVSCIPSAALGLDREYRIILVDNGTPAWIPSAEQKDTPVVPEQQSEPVRKLFRPIDSFIRLEENIGYPGAMNTAASRGTSPYVLILTSDVYLEPGAITAMAKELDQNEKVGIVAPLLMFPLDESPHGPPGGVQSAGIAFDIQGNPFHIFIGWTPQNPRVKIRREMQAVTGACFMTRRSLWNQVGGFASVYGAGTYEDMEYCFSVRSLGYSVVFQPEAQGYHFAGGSIIQGAGKSGFPLALNATIFKGRWAHALEWDAFKYLNFPK